MGSSETSQSILAKLRDAFEAMTTKVFLLNAERPLMPPQRLRI